MPQASQLETLITNYRPAPEVLQKLDKVTLYAIVAPYSCGKDSIIDWLVANHPDKFVRIVGDTTRQPRQGEIEGIVYNFRSKEKMLKDLRASRFVQVAPGFMGDFYATRPEQYPTNKIALKPIQAREMARYKAFGLKELKWLQIVPVSDEAWLRWQTGRTLKSQDQLERNQEAIQSYTLALENPDAQFVLNDEIKEAARRILQVVEGKALPDNVEARQTAAHNLEAFKKRLRKNTQQVKHL